jgi:hypothetical protein
MMSRSTRKTQLVTYAMACMVLSACGGTSPEASTDAQASVQMLQPERLTRMASSQASAVAPIPPTACEGVPGRVLAVGPGRTYATPSAAAAAAQPGDIIEIAAGDYVGDVATWYPNDLTICGIGGRARLFAHGKNAGGKGIWVVMGNNVTVDSIEFHDAKVPDHNGAGIRAGGGNLAVRSSGFFDNENGILGGTPGATITIEGSEFARNGFGDGLTHNIYISSVDKLVVTSSFFHEAKGGHNLKSRARETHVENSYFMDGPKGTSSYLNDFSNGGAVYLRGNLYQKGPKAQNSIAIAYAQEGFVWAINTLEMVHNTVVITRSGGSFLAAPGGTQSVKLTANLFAGTNNPSLISGGFSVGSIVQSDNVTSVASNIPGADNIAAPSFWPNNTLLALVGLADVPDSTYLTDSPQPFLLRSISGSSRLAGALQSKP